MTALLRGVEALEAIARHIGARTLADEIAAERPPLHRPRAGLTRALAPACAERPERARDVTRALGDPWECAVVSETHPDGMLHVARGLRSLCGRVELSGVSVPDPPELDRATMPRCQRCEQGITPWPKP